MERDLLTLSNYVCGYACKEAETTEDFITVYKTLLENADENASVRSLAQRLLLKTVGMVDIPAAAADLMLSGGKLTRATRRVNRFGLSGFRVMADKESAARTGKATKDNKYDRFHKAAADGELSPGYTLWEYASECKSCNCGAPHAPLFTGRPYYPTWPLSEDVALTHLMIHVPHELWKKPEDLLKLEGPLKPHATYVEAFGAFFGLGDMTQPQAPPEPPPYCRGEAEVLTRQRRKQMVCELAIAAKRRADEKVARAAAAAAKKKQQLVRRPQQTEDDANDPFEDDDAEHDTDEATRQLAAAAALADAARGDDGTDPIDDAAGEEPLPDGGEGFDFHAHAQKQLGLRPGSKLQWGPNPKKWLSELAKTVETAALNGTGWQRTLPTSRLRCANRLQRLVIAINMKRLVEIRKTLDENQHAGNEAAEKAAAARLCELGGPLRLLVQGTAGTGKTFVVTAVTRLARRLFPEVRPDINLAPTGAASTLLPDGGTVHLLTVPKLGEGEKKSELCDHKLSDDKLKVLRGLTGTPASGLRARLLNCDERSMWSHRLLGWASHRYHAPELPHLQ